jgi:DNA-binding protein HU-beta
LSFPKTGGIFTNKTELIAQIAAETEVDKKKVDLIVNEVFDKISAALSSREKVTIAHFGTFEVHYGQERIGRNPRTKEEITIPAQNRPVFKHSLTLKKAVN